MPYRSGPAELSGAARAAAHAIRARQTRRELAQVRRLERQARRQLDHALARLDAAREQASRTTYVRVVWVVREVKKDPAEAERERRAIDEAAAAIAVAEELAALVQARRAALEARPGRDEPTTPAAPPDETELAAACARLYGLEDAAGLADRFTAAAEQANSVAKEAHRAAIAACEAVEVADPSPDQDWVAVCGPVPSGSGNRRSSPDSGSR